MDTFLDIYNFICFNLDTSYKVAILVIALINIIFVLRNWYLKQTENYYKLYDMFLTLKGKYENFNYVQKINNPYNLEKRMITLAQMTDDIAFYSISINDQIKTIKNKKELRIYFTALYELGNKTIEQQIQVLNETCEYIFLKFNKKYKKEFNKFRKNRNICFGLGIRQAKLFDIHKLE